MNKKKNIILATIFILIIIFILWINLSIPKQIAKISASHYLKKNFPKMKFEYVDIEWADTFGGYIIKFKDSNNKLCSFIMNYKYFSISPGQGTFALEEEYRQKYGNSNNEISNFTTPYIPNNVNDSNIIQIDTSIKPQSHNHSPEREVLNSSLIFIY